MKRKTMKPIMKKSWLILLGLLWMAPMLNAQEMMMEEPDNRPVKNMFNSIWLIDDPSPLVPIKGTFEFDIQHRFGTVKNGYQDFWGFYAPANIRLGFGYVPVNRLMVGFGFTKVNLTWDVNAKYALIQQTNSGSSPVALTYYFNAAFDTREKDFFLNPDELVASDRVSYFHQLILGRKFNDWLSMQITGSLSHFNTVDALKNEDQVKVDVWKNDHFEVSAGAKFKVSPVMNVLVNFDQPLTKHDIQDPEPGLSFGIEINTSSHQFQFFAGNFYNITPQRNYVFNANSISNGDFLIGFNMVRLWNF